MGNDYSRIYLGNSNIMLIKISLFQKYKPENNFYHKPVTHKENV